MEARLWNRYALALEAFKADPSPRNEGVVLQAYAEFARTACPEQADDLISLATRHLARFIADERRG
jgi:hypothetical protein